MGRWKEYFEEPINEETERECRVEVVTVVDQEVAEIIKYEVRKALKKIMGKVDGPDDIPVEVWKCLRELVVEYLTRFFNKP